MEEHEQAPAVAPASSAHDGTVARPGSGRGGLLAVGNAAMARALGRSAAAVPLDDAARRGGNAALARSVGTPPGVRSRPAGRRVLRALDASKAKPIEEELDSIRCKTLGITGPLEDMWAALGRDLPTAVNDPAYRDLWRISVYERGMNVDDAAAPLRTLFATDTRSAGRQLANDKKLGLDHLRKDLEAAAAQKQSKVVKEELSGGIQDDKAKTSRVAGQRRFEVRDLLDTATLVDFLQNWDAQLRKVPIGVRSVGGFSPLGAPDRAPGTPEAAPSFNPFPNAPTAPAPGGAKAPPPATTAQILFDPMASREQIMRLSEMVDIDDDRLEMISRVHRECTEHKTDFSRLAESLIGEDVNLQALAKQGMIGQVSAFGGHSDEQASSALSNTVKENMGKLDAFLGVVDTVDWKALRPVHGMLLSGTAQGTTGVNWSEFVTREFINGYFTRKAEADRKEAEAKLIADLVLGGITLIALLSPAAPLAALVLTVADVYAATQAVKGVADAKAADVNADQLGKAADAGAATRADADKAKREADEKNSHIAMDLLLAALPFVPGAAKAGAEALGSLRGEGRLVKSADESKAFLRAAHGDENVAGAAMRRHPDAEPATLRNPGGAYLGAEGSGMVRAEAVGDYFQRIQANPNIEYAIIQHGQSRKFGVLTGSMDRVVRPDTLGAEWEIIRHYHPNLEVDPITGALRPISETATEGTWGARLPSTGTPRDPGDLMSSSMTSGLRRMEGRNTQVSETLDWFDPATNRMRTSRFGYNPNEQARFWIEITSQSENVLKGKFTTLYEAEVWLRKIKPVNPNAAKARPPVK